MSLHATATGKSSGPTWLLCRLYPYALWNQGGLRAVLRAEVQTVLVLYVFFRFSFLAPNIFGRICSAVLLTDILFLCSDTCRPHCAREIRKRSFVSTVKPTIHTNPS